MTVTDTVSAATRRAQLRSDVSLAARVLPHALSTGNLHRGQPVGRAGSHALRTGDPPGR